MKSAITTMVGRHNERAALEAFVESSAGHALLLRGETGVGKSALVRHAAESAEQSGHVVVRAAGVEAESGLPYAGLHQVLHPLLAGVTQLDAGSQTVFATVFGRAEGNPPSLLTLGIAVLDLLAKAADHQPLLLILDDGQWLDDSSVDVYGFVCRRLAGTKAKLLAAVRTDIPSRFDVSALPELVIPPLPAQEAELLLDERHPGLHSRIRRTVLAQAQGNPLALLELPVHISSRSEELDDLSDHSRVALPRRLQQVYSARIAALPDAVRAELLLGALDGVGTGPGDRLTPTRRYRMRDADAAVACGLLDVEPATGDVIFHHPLVRSAVVQMATPNQRRAAHQELAQLYVDNLERRATHLAAATVDPDPEVADILEAAAESVTRRGGALTAVTWLTRAAELSEDGAQRSRRMANAAFIAGHAARLGQARRLAVAEAPGVGETPAAVLASAYQALYVDGDVHTTHRQVMTAIEKLRDEGMTEPDEVLARLVTLLLAISQYSGDAATWERTHELLASIDGLLTERERLYSSTWSDVVRHGAGWGAKVERATGSLSDMEPWEISRLAAAAYHLDVLSEFRPHLQRVVSRELETGAVAVGMVMLHQIMLDQMAVGEWDAAEDAGRLGLELATEQGHELFAMQSRAYLAQLAALRGQVGRAHDLQAEVDAWARPRRIGFLTQVADSVGATGALSAGDYETAYLYAVGITSPGVFQPYVYQGSRTLLDLVEAALHTGRTEQARQHAVAARDAGLADISPRLALITYAALGMTAIDDQEAEEMFALVESHPAATRFPFEVARVRLAHGVRMRHVKGRAEARRLLTTAFETFERLGATGWTDRARAELRATGTTPRVSMLNITSLTWQERRIADLAASGLTNKEIGKRMHLSPRTVSSHLYRVFPKLGITTRASLRDALSRTEEFSER